VRNFKAPHKIGIIAAPGDRLDEDIVEIGRHAAEMFDEIIIRHDKNRRGRANEEITSLLSKGLHQINTGARVNVISDEYMAMKYAVGNAPEGSFIVSCADDVHGAINYIRQMQQDEQSKTTVKV
jgi:cyanophycin synthetase